MVDYTGGSPAAAVRQRILSGRGGGGLGKTWNGPGITSSTVATVNATQPKIALGRLRREQCNATRAVHGVPRPAGRHDHRHPRLHAAPGDANLDGVVNNDDVTVIGISYAQGTGAMASGAPAILNTNNSVDNDDVTLLGGHFYNPHGAPLPPPAPAVSTTDEGRSTMGATAGLSSSAEPGTAYRRPPCGLTTVVAGSPDPATVSTEGLPPRRGVPSATAGLFSSADQDEIITLLADAITGSNSLSDRRLATTRA